MEDSLNDDLLWQAHGWFAARPSTWRAPSWSWASAEASIYYLDAPLFWDDGESREHRDQKDYNHFCEVVSWKCTPAGLNRLGELKNGYLQLSGSCEEATLTYNSLEKPCPQERALINGILQYNALPPKRRIYYKLVFHDGITLDMQPDYDLSQRGTHHITSGTRVICVRMSSFKLQRGECLFSLILRSVDLESNNFERSGLLVDENLNERNHTSVYRSTANRRLTIV
jgi:hypothetical protein